eukprot:scaffold7734_cov296-Pinguiococcus_pyrenoidosus.AAC.1
MARLVKAPLCCSPETLDQLGRFLDVLVCPLVLLGVQPALGELQGVAGQVHPVREAMLLTGEEQGLPTQRFVAQEAFFDQLHVAREKPVVAEAELNVHVGQLQPSRKRSGVSPSLKRASSARPPCLTFVYILRSAAGLEISSFKATLSALQSST